MIRRRVRVGRDVWKVSEDLERVELQGPARLRPGEDVEVITVTAGVSISRSAVVWSWCLVATDRDGLTFRGVCRWT